MLDIEHLFAVSAERLFFLMLSLIAEDFSEKYDSSEETHSIMKAELQSSLNEMNHYCGTVSERDFTLFLLNKGICTAKGVETVASELRKVTDVLSSRKCKLGFKEKYPVVFSSKSIYPPVFEQAFVLAISDASYLNLRQFLSDCSGESSTPIDYLYSHRSALIPLLSPKETGAFELYEFLQQKCISVLQKKKLIEGLCFTSPISHCAEELTEQFLFSSVAYNPSKKEVYGIILSFLQHYDKLLSEIISAVMGVSISQMPAPSETFKFDSIAPLSPTVESSAHNETEESQMEYPAPQQARAVPQIQIVPPPATIEPKVKKGKGKVVKLALDLKANVIRVKPNGAKVQKENAVTIHSVKSRNMDGAMASREKQQMSLKNNERDNAVQAKDASHTAKHSNISIPTKEKRQSRSFILEDDIQSKAEEINYATPVIAKAKVYPSYYVTRVGRAEQGCHSKV